MNNSTANGNKIAAECDSAINYPAQIQFWQKKNICIWVAIVAVVLVAICFVFVQEGNPLLQRVEFKDISYSQEGIAEFTNIVITNIDAEDAMLVTEHSDGPYASAIKIKPKGSIAATLYLHFNNSNDSDTIACIQTSFSDQVTENEFVCYKKLIAALEKTLCGKSYIQDYLSSRSSIASHISTSNSFKKEVYATYKLTHDLSVTITTRKSSSWGSTGWSVGYLITAC